jgi:hypothetical protein
VVRLPKGDTGTRRHIITAKAVDKYGYTGETEVEIIVTDSMSDETPTPEPEPKSDKPELPPAASSPDSTQPTI